MMKMMMINAVTAGVGDIKTVIEVSFPSTNKTSKKSSSKVENKGKEKNSNVKRTSSVIKEIKRKSEK